MQIVWYAILAITAVIVVTVTGTFVYDRALGVRTLIMLTAMTLMFTAAIYLN